VASLSAAAPALADPLRTARAARLWLALGGAAIAVYFLLPSPGDLQPVWFVAVGAASAGVVYVGSVRNVSRRDRLPWNLFALGLLGQVGGDAVYALYEIEQHGEPSSPSVADAFFVTGYPLVALGVFLVLKRLGGRTSRAAALDSIVVFCGVAVVQWVFFIDPFRHLGYGSGWVRLHAIAYPAVDVLLLASLVQMLLGPGGRTAAYRLLLAAVALWVIADEGYVLHVSTYRGADWNDAFWLGSYVAFGAAALVPSAATFVAPERRRLPRLTRRRLAFLAAALVVGPAVSIYEQFEHGRSFVYVVAPLTAAIGVLVLLRLSDLVRVVDASRRAERAARCEAEQAQALLTHQNQQLVELDRVKDEFVSGVSHELRTPLTSITGYVELLLEEESRVDRREHLRIIERNAERLHGLVSDLLLTARLREGALTIDESAVDLGELAVRAAASARAQAESSQVALDVELDSVPPVRGDATKLEQLLDNLVSNAIKFTPPGGEVSVRLGAKAGTVRLEVQDTGIGIASGDRERVFKRFFRSQSALERHIQGTGLGLHISKAIVDAHGGRIGVESVEGEGSTFTVELPMAVP
jgi:signal transduction histidine kinase